MFVQLAVGMASEGSNGDDIVALRAQVSLAKAVEELTAEKVCVGVGVCGCVGVRRCVQFLHRHVLRVGFSCLR